jgi:hypothetical protein
VLYASVFCSSFSSYRNRSHSCVSYKNKLYIFAIAETDIAALPLARADLTSHTVTSCSDECSQALPEIETDPTSLPAEVTDLGALTAKGTNIPAL